jgi:hypothetical protein
MKRIRTFRTLAALIAVLGAGCGVAPAARASAQGQATPATAATPAPHGPAKVCLDARTSDRLTRDFVARLEQRIGASGALNLARTPAACALTLHVPGNVLRFQTQGGLMVGTVVIVTSASNRYLSTSIAACQAKHLGPCAVRAVTAAKLALLVAANEPQ